MKKDIEQTRMEIAFRKVLSQIQPFLQECLDTNGEVCAAYVLRQLAIEFAARNFISMRVLTQENDYKNELNVFTVLTTERIKQLIEEGVNLGIFKAKQ